jgi:hypothetical protein
MGLFCSLGTPPWDPRPVTPVCWDVFLATFANNPPPDGVRAIVSYGQDVSNTYEEARAVVEWARRTGARSVIVPTEQFSSRRVNWIFKRELAAVGVRVGIKVLRPYEHSIDDWWTKEQGVVAFQNEVLKYVYYRMKY